MKLLIYYIYSRHVQERWKRLVDLQRELLPEWDALPKVFVVDRGSDPGIPGTRVEIDLFDENGHVLFSRAKNAAIDAAVGLGAEWLLDCDVDSLLIRTPNQFPPTGYGCVPVYMASESDHDAAIRKYAQNLQVSFEGSSRFLTRRDVFSRFRYDDSFWGYGGEDLDYHENVLAPAGFHGSATDARAIHLWHRREPLERPGNIEIYRRRKQSLGDPLISRAVREGEAIQGWMSSEELQWLARRAYESNVVVEVGSWKGRSTKAMAVATPGVVYAVDHWKGAANPADATTLEVRERGSEAVRNEFFTNLSSEIKSGKVVAVEQDSSKAAAQLASILRGRGADFVFIDGDHEYPSVRRDIESFLPLVRRRGRVSGHDLAPGFEGVEKAVREFIPDYSSAVGSIWQKVVL
jgi:predicted O-methyltransferase YrrM